MKYSSIVFLFVLALGTIYADGNADTLKNMVHKGIIDIRDGDFERLVLENGRDYKSFILFTANSHRFNCPVCRELNGYYEKVAQLAAPKIKDAQIPIFFIRVDYGSAPQSFKMFKLPGIPFLAFFEPKDKTASKMEMMNIVENNKLMIGEGSMNLESVLSFFNRKTGIELSIEPSLWPQVIFVIIMLCCLPFIAQFILDHLEYFLSYREKKWLFTLGALVVYFVSVSGVMYDIIRNPPPFYCREGGCMFVNPSSGQQFSLEGFLAGMFNIVAAFVLWLLVKKYLSFKPENVTKYTLICLGIFTVCFSFTIRFYVIKAGWYPYRLL